MVITYSAQKIIPYHGSKVGKILSPIVPKFCIENHGSWYYNTKK